MAVSFDELDTANDFSGKPLWAINKKDEKELLQWCIEDFNQKKMRYEQLNQVFYEHLCMYKGVQYRSMRSSNNDNDSELKDNQRAPRVVINHIYDLVETNVSKLTRYRPAITVEPFNIYDYKDGQNAKMIKKLIDARWNDANLDKFFRDIELGADIFGYCFMMISWDPNAGKTHPDYEDAIKKGKQVKITTESGDTVNITKAVKVGDVQYKIVRPDHILLQNKGSMEDVEHATYVSYVNIDNVKAMYSKKQNDISGNSSDYLDLDAYHDNINSSDILLKRVFHRSTPELPDGMIITFCDDCILDVRNLVDMYPDGDFPWIIQTDIDVTGEQLGRSAISNIRQAQRHYNNLASGVARNHGIASMPKWVTPQGMCDIKQLENGSTVIQYKGPTAPQLVAFSPTAPEVFKYMDKLELIMEKLKGIHATSRGAPPSGVTSGVAMQFLDEQENERASSRVAKRNSNVLACAKKTLLLMQKYYKKEDGRVYKSYDSNFKFDYSIFENADFNDSYDVRIQKGTSLPESKAMRTQTIIDLKTAFPTSMTDQMALEMLDFSFDQKFRDYASAAVRAAEYENENILSGKPQTEPVGWEDHVSHYRMHMIDIQDAKFKEQPREIQQAMVDHIMATEYLMDVKMRANSEYAKLVLQTFPHFPIFFNNETEVPPAPMQRPMPPLPMVGPQGPDMGTAMPPQDFPMDAQAGQLPPELMQMPLPQGVSAPIA
jgi:hypothetical protein